MNVQSIINKIEQVYSTALRKPAINMNPILIACSFAKRPGLSVIMSTGKIIERLGKRGIPTEDGRDGTPNKTNILVHAIVSEVFRALQEDYSIDGSCMPGSISFAGTVNTPAGPVPVEGYNVNAPRITSRGI